MEHKLTPKVSIVEKTDKEKKENSNEEEEEQQETMKEKISIFNSLNQPMMLKNIAIALGVLVVALCVGFIVYQFYTKKAQQKIDICVQDKMDGYEKRLKEMSEQNELVIGENTRLTQRMNDLQNEYNKLLESSNDITKNTKKQAVFKTTKKPTQKNITIDEDNEYTVEHLNFDDAPINKNKKRVNPQQALKTHINENAKKSYDKKQSMIRQQMDNDRDEQEEREQFEIQQQLGLTREINDEKIMKLVDEQDNEQKVELITEDDKNEEIADDQLEEIDSSLIA